VFIVSPWEDGGKIVVGRLSLVVGWLTDLFTTQRVKVELPPEEFPRYKGDRVVCDACGEGINFRREVRRDGKTLCRSCAGERYYESA